MTDAAGLVRFGPGSAPGANTNVSDRDYFLWHRDGKGGLFVSNPIFGRFDKVWVVSFSRRYTNAKGEFAGVVAASLPVSYFDQLLSTLNVGPHGTALLRDADTGLVAHQPPLDSPAWRVGAKGYSKELGQIIASGVAAATFHAKQTADGVERLNSYRRLTAAPFHLVVGMGTDDYLAEWRAEVVKAITLDLFFLAASIISASLLWRSFSVIERTRDHIEAAQVKLRFANSELLRLTEVMAHHLQEPARRLVTFAQRLKRNLDGHPLEADALQSLSFIEQQAIWLRSLIRDIQLYLAASQPLGEVHSLPLNAAVDKVAMARAADLAAIGAKLTVQPAMPSVMLDSRRLTDIFDILFDNALRYRRPQTPLHIKIGADIIETRVRMSFADNGTGIEPAYRERVFGIFERLNPTADDDRTGVGLSVVQRIASDNDGKVWVEETPGGGATFMLELPLGAP